MQGDGQNVVDNIKDNVFKKDDVFYDVRTGEIINGNQANERVRGNKTYFYQQFLNSKDAEPLSQLNSVYRYLFNTSHNFIPIEDGIEIPMTTPNTRFEQRPQSQMQVDGPKASDTFLNNIEKILRIKKGNVKPGGKPELQNDLINNARDFLGGR